MSKNNLVKYDIENVKVEKAIQDLKEMFSKFDLKDNTGIIFKACIERIENELKLLNTNIKGESKNNKQLNLELKEKIRFEDFAIDKLSKKDIIEYYRK